MREERFTRDGGIYLALYNSNPDGLYSCTLCQTVNNIAQSIAISCISRDFKFRCVFVLCGLKKNQMRKD